MSNHGDKCDAIDLLAKEDEALIDLFGELEPTGKQRVEDRVRRGELGKQLVRRLAVREAAKADLVRVIEKSTKLDSVRQQLIGDVQGRRAMVNTLAHMSRHVRAIELNRAQDFEGAVLLLRAVIDDEIRWELGEGLPALRRELTTRERSSLRSARYLRHHAPTKLHVEGFRRYERIRLVSWLLTRWNHLEDRPLPISGMNSE